MKVRKETAQKIKDVLIQYQKEGKTKTDFIKEHRYYYNVLKEKGKLHVLDILAVRIKWSKERLEDAMKQCLNLRHFIITYPGGYAYAIRNKLTHILKEYYKTIKDKIKNIYLNENHNLFKEAMKYRTIKRLKKMNHSLYMKLRSLGILREMMKLVKKKLRERLVKTLSEKKECIKDAIENPVSNCFIGSANENSVAVKRHTQKTQKKKEKFNIFAELGKALGVSEQEVMQRVLKRAKELKAEEMRKMRGAVA